jgi:hypothetical protein
MKKSEKTRKQAENKAKVKRKKAKNYKFKKIGGFCWTQTV